MGGGGGDLEVTAHLEPGIDVLLLAELADLVHGPLSRMGVSAEALQTAEVQAWVIDTRFFGSKLYDDSFQEVGVSLGKPLPTFGHYIRVGATYFHAHHSNGAFSQGRLRDRHRCCRDWRRAGAGRSSAVGSLWHGGVLRDDYLRHRRLLLIRT